MVDAEKVIKGLECHSEPKESYDECFCKLCPYDDCTCGLDVPADALSLIRAQQERIRELEAAQTTQREGVKLDAPN